MKTNAIWYELVLRPMTGGPFQVDYYPTLVDLEIPRQIDLEAAT